MHHCNHCDTQYMKWQGQCSECGKWGTIVEESTTPAVIGGATKKTSKSKKQINSNHKSVPLLDLKNSSTKTTKYQPTNIAEFDRVLSGGLVSGSVTLLAGEPGIGKSTLLAQVANSVAENGKKKVMYISGEESQGQVAMRFDRLNIKPSGLVFSNTIETGSIIATAIEAKPDLLIIDSIQTMIASSVDSLPGSPNSVRSATAEFIGLAKNYNIPVLLIGQVTKDGTVAGPKTLEHLVDTVITLEGDEQNAYRLMRVAKHRFGSTDEIGIFEMTEKGMISVENPSARFLEERVDAPGSVITCVMEGNRPFLIEVQALVEKSYFPNPIRRATGYDSGRLQMLLAIISKRAGVSLGDQDVYVNIIGGLKVKETSADLAVIAAIISSFKDIALKQNAVYIGEVGLSGEIRKVPFLDRRIKEAKRLKFDTIFSPKTVKMLSDLFRK
jgi:DNA repair protein RadA/Sms